MRAARELFEARGFEDVRVEEITAAAGISKRTFFRYFPTKEDVVFPDHDRRLQRFGELVRLRQPDESALAAVHRAFVALGTQLMADRDEVVALQRIVDRSPTLVAADRARDRQWDEMVARSLARDGEPAPTDRFAAGALMGALRAVLRVWYDADGTPDLVALGLEAFALLTRGLEPNDPKDQAGA